MIIKLENFKGNPSDHLRRAGYVFQKKEGEESAYIRALSRSGFPRFHLFASIRGGDLIMNIHLDQKRATYGSAKRHHGEYGDSSVLEEEAERIKSALEA